jgi:predicted phosphodiesterase
LELEKIKQRDKWACRNCGNRFYLDVFRFANEDTEDSFITLCPDCIGWAGRNYEEAVKLFKSLVTRNKVVLLGDIHGNFSKLDEILTEEDPFNFFICVGDVAVLNDMGLVTTHAIIDKWGDKGYFVYGTHDEVECFTPLTLSQEINGLHISGLNGILKSRNFIKDTARNISFREIMYLSHLHNVDILVTHQPPTGVFNGIGEPVLEELLNYLVPRIYVFGHVHTYRLKFHLNTFMISLPIITKGHAVAYFQGRELRNLEIILKKGKRFIRV